MFTKQQREIYGPYDDGTDKPKHGDPLHIRNRLVQLLKGDPEKVLNDALSEIPPVQVGAQLLIADAVRDAFGLVPFDAATGQGADDGYCLALLNDYLGWRAKKKERAEKHPTSPPSTA